MFKYICLILIFPILGAGYVSAQGPPNHPGKICVNCHQKYSDNDAIKKFSPCAKSTCHRSSSTGRWGGGPANRYSLHLQQKVCVNCHKSAGDKYDVHSIHLKFEELGLNRTAVECKICHNSPKGYNSSIAHVPPYEDLYIAGSTLMNTSIRRPPWNNDCGYCHPSVTGAKRLHDVHAPVIEGACKVCHGPIIESKLDLIAKITGKPLRPLQKVVKTQSKEAGLFVKEFSRLFEDIALQILRFYKSLKT